MSSNFPFKLKQNMSRNVPTALLFTPMNRYRPPNKSPLLPLFREDRGYCFERILMSPCLLLIIKPFLLSNVLSILDGLCTHQSVSLSHSVTLVENFCFLAPQPNITYLINVSMVVRLFLLLPGDGLLVPMFIFGSRRWYLYFSNIFLT